MSLLSVVEVTPARACSPVPGPPSYFALGATAPLDGATDVPIDAAIAVDLESHGGGPVDKLAISVFEADTGNAVAGKFGVFFWGRMLAFWRPAADLRPQTRYRVAATVKSQAPRPAAAVGTEDISFTFTTGQGRLSPIQIQGGMQVRLESEERPDYSTCQPGLCSCTPTDTLQGTRARLVLPQVSGGQSNRSYHALVMVTADRPYQFHDDDRPSGQLVFANASTVVRPGESVELLVSAIDGATRTNRPCFALRIEDMAGNVALGEPVCLDQAVDPSSKASGGGCAIGGAGVGGRGGAVTLGPLGAAVALAFLLRSRRLRPSRNAFETKNGTAFAERTG